MYDLRNSIFNLGETPTVYKIIYSALAEKPDYRNLLTWRYPHSRAQRIKGLTIEAHKNLCPTALAAANDSQPTRREIPRAASATAAWKSS
jgi:hypothetical protein